MVRMVTVRGGVSRRAAIRAGMAAMTGMFWCAPRGMAASRFWESRPVSQWTADEVAQISVNSPWAKQVTAQYRAAYGERRPDSEPVQGRGESRVGECGLVPCGDVQPGTVTVIWESALPIREALRSAIPPEYNGHYVISMRGLAGEQTPDRLKAAAELSAKGKAALQPGLVSRRGGTWLCGFSREMMALDAGDKEVRFTVRTGADLTATLLRATFSPKEMIYRGGLAL
jgi:hypothetical protein